LDNLTHSLFGLTLARTPLGRAGRGTTTALLLASNAPDIDIVTAAGGAARYLEWHRGPTHGPPGLVGLSLLVAALVWAGRRRDRSTGDAGASFLMLWVVSAVGIACHVLMDLPTAYGTRLFSPVSWTWFSIDLMPIVDVYLLAILAACMWFARGGRDERERLALRRRNAAIALVLMAANYGVRAVSHRAALERAPQVFGARMPSWCAGATAPGGGFAHWPDQPERNPRDVATLGRCTLALAAMPDFFSPFRWRLIAQLPGEYEVRDVDLLTGRGMPDERLASRRQSERIPNHWTPAVTRAAEAPLARTFLGFSRFPAARSVIGDDGTATVRWTDVRFESEPQRGARGLFSVTVHLDANGGVRQARLGPQQP
jgi:membrane-bound metal-dependent hydrolase YbcI (DUF457 family)